MKQLSFVFLLPASCVAGDDTGLDEACVLADSGVGAVARGNYYPDIDVVGSVIVTAADFEVWVYGFWAVPELGTVCAVDVAEEVWVVQGERVLGPDDGVPLEAGAFTYDADGECGPITVDGLTVQADVQLSVSHAEGEFRSRATDLTDSMSETELIGATVTVTEEEVVIEYTDNGVEQRVVYAIQDRDTGAR